MNQTPPVFSTASSTWRRDLIWLTLILAVWFGLFLGARPLSNPDEGRYTEIPREMAVTGDFVTPRLDGVKYFEKPPLLYWLSGITIKAAGANEWTGRLWFAIFGIVGGLITYAATRSLFGRAAGWWAAIVLSSTLLYYVLSHTAILDLPVAVFISAALFAFLLGVRTSVDSAGRRSRRRWLFWAFYAAMALAILTKGLIGLVLPCAVAFVWLLVFNQWKFLRPCHPFTGALVLLVIAAPWHILAGIANHAPGKMHDFTWFYFVHEHYLRFTTTEHARVGAWWFFVPVIIAGLIPWAAFAWQALRANLRGACSWAARREPARADVWFLVTWIVVITLFFSKSQSKLIPYILPVFPAFAALIGRYIADALAALRVDAAARAGCGLRAGLRIAALLGLVFAIALIVFPLAAPQKIEGLDITPGWLLGWQIFLGAVLGGGAILTVALASMRRERAALGVMIASFGIFMLSANFVAGPFDSRSTKTVSLALRERLAATPSAEVYCLGDYFQDVPVYTGRLVNIVNYTIDAQSFGELNFGVTAEAEKTAARFIDGPEFFRRWRDTAARAYAIVQKRDTRYIAELKAAGNSAIIAENARYLLLVNEAAK